MRGFHTPLGAYFLVLGRRRRFVVDDGYGDQERQHRGKRISPATIKSKD